MTGARREMGETLRRQRERRGVPVEVIAKRTNVSSSLFVALERGDCSRWPAGIYARAYLRDYADAVDLDPEDVLARVAQVYPELVWPGAPPDASAALATAGALRLSLEPEEHETVRVVVARLRTVALEVVLAAALSLAVFFVGAPFWMTLAIALVCMRTLGALAGPSALAVAGRLRSQPAPEEATASEAGVSAPAGAREAAV